MRPSLLILPAIIVFGCSTGKQIPTLQPAVDGQVFQDGGSIAVLDGGAPRPDTKKPPPKSDTAPPKKDSSAGATPVNIVITEVMANPNTVNDSKGEWFEIYNAGSASVNLDGWTIKDKDKDSHVIKNLTIGAGKYLVLGNNKDTKTNGGVAVSYSYGTGWYLANVEDEIYLVDTKMKQVSKLEYNTTKGWTIPTGSSLSLKKVSLLPLVTNWCQEKNKWSGSIGDTGTPNKNTSCGP